MHYSTGLGSRFVIALLAAVTMTMTAWADVPSAPVNLNAYANHNGDGFSDVILTWEEGDDNADGYDLFMSTDGGVTYQLFDRTSDSAGTSTHRYQTRTLPNGTYHFQVGAYNADGESARSNTASVELHGLGVRFAHGYHADSTVANTLYEVDFDAEASDGGDVIYSLVEPLPGMTINASTGLFTWTPSLPGHYVILVKATMASHPEVNAILTYVIVVNFGPGDLCATISGTINDQDNNPVTHGTVNVILSSHGRTFVLSEQFVNGTFSIAVPEGSMIVEFTGGNFRSEYYDNVTSAELAEQIVLECGGSRTLAVTVEPAPVHPRGMIFGSLVDTAGHQLNGRVIAYRIDSLGVPVVQAETWARGGYYGLYELPAGEYVLQGIASDTVHVPGYYLDGQIAALTWTEATRIDLDEADSLIGAIITLVYVEGEGQARLRGTVVEQGGRIRKQEETRILSSTPVEGATVYALNASNTVSGYAITDAAGNFEIRRLKEGNYTVLVDKVGLRPLYQPTGVKNNEPTEIDLTMTSVTSSVADITSQATQLAIYPNPVGASATVRFHAAAGNTNLRVIDLRGTEVISMSIATTAGENSVRLETAALPAGVYLLQVGSGSGSVSTMITVGR